MIPNNVKVVERQGDLGGRRIRMGVSEKGLPYIMNLLTDLYGDPILACIREYSTNAWDSHIDAGNTHLPIHVTTPNGLNPYLTIRDFGVGMDELTIEQVYVWYGESTKREQKTTNGSMGIGAKAALGYTNQFMVTGFKDGVKTLVSVTRDDDGSGAMDIVHVGPTDEPNGVEIKIPAKRIDDFTGRAEKFFRFWKPGTVLLNGTGPQAEVTMITDRIGVLDHSGSDLIVMGNVAYPVDSSYSWSYGDMASVAYVTMNGDDEVVFTPSREGLIYNSITQKSIAGIKEEYNKHLVQHLTNEINAPGLSYVDAYRKMLDYRRIYPTSIISQVNYQGARPLANFVLTHTTKNDAGVDVSVSTKFVKWTTGRHRHAVETGALFFDTLVNRDDTKVIVNYPGSGISSDAKKRIRAYFNAIGEAIGGYYSNSTLVVCTDKPALPLPEVTGGIKTYDWKTILKETRAERVSTAGTRVSDGTFEAFVNGTWDYSYEIDDTDHVVYWSDSVNWDSFGPGYDDLKAVSPLFPDHVFVRSSANRHSRIERISGSSERWAEFWPKASKKVYAQDFDALTDEDFKVLAYHKAYEDNYEYAFGVYRYSVPEATFKRYKPFLDTIDDKEYTEVVQYLLTEKPEVNRADLDSRWAATISKHAVKPILFVNDRYPLINRTNVDDVANCIEYMNFKHAQRMEKN